MHARVRSAIFTVLYAEIVINTVNGFVSIVAPAAALQGLSNVDVSSGEHDLALEVYRWFGVMCFVFGGFLLYRVLRIPSVLRPLLEALLMGDVLYCAALVPFARQYGAWPFIVFPFALTLVMFAARLFLLLGEDWRAREAEAAAVKRE